MLLVLKRSLPREKPGSSPGFFAIDRKHIRRPQADHVRFWQIPLKKWSAIEAGRKLQRS
jgi:hypothetical protein